MKQVHLLILAALEQGRRVASGKMLEIDFEEGLPCATGINLSWDGCGRLGGKGWLCGYRAHAGASQSAVLESDDGFVWKFARCFRSRALGWSAA